MDAYSSMSDSSPSPPSMPIALLSPPDSQHSTTAANTHASRTSSSAAASAAGAAPRSMPVISSSANANGKRPLNTISNGFDLEDEDAERVLRANGGAGANGTAAAPANTSAVRSPAQENARGVYQWERPEDEPGYAWLNKKAVDEYNRAMEGLVHKDSMVQARYGDPIEMAEREAAILASTQR